MSALGRRAVLTVGRPSSNLTQSTRRFASDHAGDHGHSAPKAESLGSQFYLVLAAFPVAIGVYTISRPSEDGEVRGLTQIIIDSYMYYKERFAARNTLHTTMIEQAAFDRNLYQSSQGSKHIELKFPEIFNTGSPFNVSAGQGPRNMDQLVAHYEKLNADDEVRKAKAIETTKKDS